MLRWIPACDAIEKNVFFPVGLSPRARQQARVKARWRGSHLAGRPHDQRGAISAAPADWTATCPHASQSVSQAVWGRPGVCAEGRLSQQRATKLRCPYHKVYHRYTGGSSYYPLPSTCSYNEIPTLKEYHHRLSRARMRRVRWVWRDGTGRSSHLFLKSRGGADGPSPDADTEVEVQDARAGSDPAPSTCEGVVRARGLLRRRLRAGSSGGLQRAAGKVERRAANDSREHCCPFLRRRGNDCIEIAAA
jgi:hypothetical protein